MNKITRAEATYTGGGIYIYTGQLNDGRFFLAADDWEDFVYLLDADPYEDFDNALYPDWQEEHTTFTLMFKDAFDFWKTMLQMVEMLDCDKDLRLEQLAADYPQYAD